MYVLNKKLKVKLSKKHVPKFSPLFYRINQISSVLEVFTVTSREQQATACIRALQLLGRDKTFVARKPIQ